MQVLPLTNNFLKPKFRNVKPLKLHSMTYFNTGFVKFFKALHKNNSSVWFNENRKIYETEVKKPFERFVSDLISHIQKINPEVNIKSSEAITRINKDIRFSKEKIPYNIYVGAIISKYGRKSKEYPGIYIQLGADKISLYGGAYMLEKDNLQKVRTSISKNLAVFQKLISDKEFVKHFGSVQGEKNKVLAPEFKLLLEEQPLLANKSFYFYAELPSSLLASDKLMESVLGYYKTAKPLNDFFIKALN